MQVWYHERVWSHGFRLLSGQAALVGRDDRVPQAVCLVVNGATAGIGLVPGNGAAHAFRPGTVATKSGTQRLILRLSKTALLALSPMRLPSASGIKSGDQDRTGCG